MDQLYDRVELEDKKYTDLLQIHKSLGLKGRRTKAEKLITSILEHQCVDSSGTSDNISDELLAAAAEDVASDILRHEATQGIKQPANKHSLQDDSDSSILDIDDILFTDDQQLSCDSDKEIKNEVQNVSSPIHTKKKKKTVLEAKVPVRRRGRRMTVCAATISEESHEEARPTLKRSGTFSMESKRIKRGRSVSPVQQQIKSAKRARKNRAGEAAQQEETVVDTSASSSTAPHSSQPPHSSPPPNTDASPTMPVDDTSDEISTISRTPINSKLDSSNMNSATKKITPIGEESKETCKKTPKRTPLSNKRLTVSHKKSPKTPKASQTTVESVSVPPSDNVDISASPTLKPRAVQILAADTTVQSPIVSSIKKSAQGRRLSSAKRLTNTPAPRVVPTIAKPVFNIGKLEKVNSTKKETARSATKKTGIPRFMLQAQKISKMPNFKRIHEKAFGNMENLGEYITKKAAASAQKSGSAFVPSVVTTKNLLFNFTDKQASKASPMIRFGGSKDSCNTPIKAGASTKKPIGSSAFAPLLKENVKPRTSMSGSPFNKGSDRQSIAATPASRATPRSTALRRQTHTPAVTDRNAAVTQRHHKKDALPTKLPMKPVPAAAAKHNLATFAKKNNALLKNNASAPLALKKNDDTSLTRKRMIPAVTSISKISDVRARIASKVTKNLASSDIRNQTAAVTVRGGMSKLPRFQSSKTRVNRSPLDRATLKNYANKRPNIATKTTERRVVAHEYIKGVRTNKRFQLQMERRGIVP